MSRGTGILPAGPGMSLDDPEAPSQLGRVGGMVRKQEGRLASHTPRHSDEVPGVLPRIYKVYCDLLCTWILM